MPDEQKPGNPRADAIQARLDAFTEFRYAMSAEKLSKLNRREIIAQVERASKLLKQRLQVIAAEAGAYKTPPTCPFDPCQVVSFGKDGPRGWIDAVEWLRFDNEPRWILHVTKEVTGNPEVRWDADKCVLIEQVFAVK